MWARYKGPIQGGGGAAKKKGTSKSSNQFHGKLNREEAQIKMQEGYLELEFIPSIQSDRITLFEASLRRSNEVVTFSEGGTYQ